MRISADQRDHGWSKYQEWMPRSLFSRIYLNGVEIKHVVTADEELGEVLVVVTDGEGRPQIDGDEIRHEWRRGKVEIFMPPGATYQ